MLIKSKLFSAQVDDCRITHEDLKRLDQVKELLSLLNDPYIGPYKLKDCIEGMPSLASRCRREAALHRPRNEVEQIERALNVLGNRGIEKVLLELLEDMTIFKSELDDPVTEIAMKDTASLRATGTSKPAKGGSASSRNKS